ncbi:MAG: alpha/beta fold hydrolase [Aestuariivirga sp.]|uniref:alpha/beta fold hydrolase n=1 Tax=Aestuariivirga sp. TaxID=2650926 RepID=UPI0038D1F47F
MPTDRMIELPGGAVLHAIEAGSGQPLIMIPGWSQSAAEYGRNIDELAKTRRVIALDMRSHGESPNAEGGHRIQRLAKDLHETIDVLGLKDVDVLGHSMGSSIIWSYLDLFGTDRLRRLVIVDQAPMVAALPGWDEAAKKRYGCLLPDVQSVAGFADAVRATDSIDGTMAILKGMFTSALPESDLRWIATENLKMPRAAAADLLFDHCLNDWRDVIAATRLPTLVVGGRKSIFSPESQEWIAAVNPNATAAIFEESEGGGHFMFFENPRRFNAEVSAFLSS